MARGPVERPLTDAARAYLRTFGRWLEAPTPIAEADKATALERLRGAGPPPLLTPCGTCGTHFERNAVGRPRLHCETCRPPRCGATRRNDGRTF